MNTRRILIVGGGPAGLTAADSAREANRKAEITILSEEPHLPYRRPSIPLVIEGKVRSPKDIAIYTLPFLASTNICLLSNFKVCELDADNRLVKATNRETGREETFTYDSLILATGGKAFKPSVPGSDKQGVFTLRTFNDAVQISRWIRPNDTAVVYGAGFIGLTIAEALLKRSMKVTLIARSRVLRGLFEPDFSSKIQREMEREGVMVLAGKNIEEIGGTHKVEYVKFDGKKLDTRLMVFATGVRPSIELAELIGVKIGKMGIKIDSKMRTSTPEIFAAGDCCESISFVTKRHTYVPVGSIASAEGRIAGINAAGNNLRTDGFIRAQSAEIFGVHMVSIGYSLSEAEQSNIKANAVNLFPQLSGRFLKSRNPFVRIKVIIDSKSKIIGGQMLGKENAINYAFDIFKAIESQMTLSELLEEWKPPYKSLASFTSWKHRTKIESLDLQKK